MNDKITLEESKSIRLSKNFTLYEFLKSDTAARYNIDNSMPREYLPRIQYLVDTILQPLRDHFGPIRINSGYRCEALSIKIGSTTHSNHCYALAADIEPYNANADFTLLDILIYIHDNLEYKELIGEYFPNGWVHVAAQEGNNKKELKLKDPTHNYARVDLNTIINSIQQVA